MRLSQMKVSEVDIIYRPKFNTADLIQVTGSEEAYEILKQYYQDGMYYREVLSVLLLNNVYKVIGIHKVSEGGVSDVYVDCKIIFQAAIKSNASAIILCHNHPAGNLKPSKHDKKTTSKVIKGGKYLDIEVLDHIIISGEGYFSFQDNLLM